jgi:hypothetical protein
MTLIIKKKLKFVHIILLNQQGKTKSHKFDVLKNYDHLKRSLHIYLLHFDF